MLICNNKTPLIQSCLWKEKNHAEIAKRDERHCSKRMY